MTYRGDRIRYGVDAVYKLGPFKLQAEWIYQTLEREKQVRVDPTTNQIVSSGGKLINAPDLNAWGWYVLGRTSSGRCERWFPAGSSLRADGRG